MRQHDAMVLMMKKMTLRGQHIFCFGLLLLLLISAKITRAVDHRVGALKGAIVFQLYNELEESAVDKELLKKRYDDQTKRYFEWASDGKLDLQFDFFFVEKSMAEKKSDGNCRSHPGADYSVVPNIDDYVVKGYVVLTTTGCSGPCAYGGGGMECTFMYDQIMLGCTDIDSSTRLCDKTFVHEMLHGLGLGYHQGGFKCTSEDIVEKKSWRDCPFEEYGGVLDILASAGEKSSHGVAAFSRSQLGWLSQEDIEIVTESTTLTIATLGAGTSELPRAAIVRFTKVSVGDLWIEFRGGGGFDTLATTKFSGFNSKGVVMLQYGTQLIDLAPDANDDNDHYRVALQPEDGWFTDTTSGLKIRTLAVSSASATFQVEFGTPPTCVSKSPQLNGDKFYIHLAKVDDLARYKAPKDEEGWGDVVVRNLYLDYAPYWGTPEMDDYKVIFGLELSAGNNDGVSCEKKTMTAYGYGLPKGWRFDEGGCQNSLGGQRTTDVCALVAVPKSAKHGAYEVLFAFEKEEDEERSVLYPLWLCLNGFNPWFQSIYNNRFPAWKCTYVDENGIEKTVMKPEKKVIPNPCDSGATLQSGDVIPKCGPTTPPTNIPAETEWPTLQPTEMTLTPTILEADPTPTPTTKEEKSGLTTGLIAGIAAGASTCVVALAALTFFRRADAKRRHLHKDVAEAALDIEMNMK